MQAHGHKRVWHDVTNLDQIRCACSGPTGARSSSSERHRAVRRRSSTCMGTDGTLTGAYRTITLERIEPGRGYVATEAHHAEAPADLLARYESGLGSARRRPPPAPEQRSRSTKPGGSPPPRRAAGRHRGVGAAGRAVLEAAQRSAGRAPVRRRHRGLERDVPGWRRRPLGWGATPRRVRREHAPRAPGPADALATERPDAPPLATAPLAYRSTPGSRRSRSRRCTCAPNALHRPWVEARRCGQHVLCEKPLPPPPRMPRRW